MIPIRVPSAQEWVAMFEKLLSFLKLKRAPPAPYEDALDRGDECAAVRLLRAAMRAQDPQAMVTYGTMLLLGQGIERDPLEGLAWIRQGAVRGQVHGMMLLGGHLAAGIYLPKNDSEAAYWLFKAASRGLLEAGHALSELVVRAPDVIGTQFRRDDFEAVMRVMKRSGTAR